MNTSPNYNPSMLPQH